MTNDNALFDHLFDRHATALHAYFLARVADRESARDLLQEVFLRVWRRIGEVRTLAPERRAAWVFTVARNLTVDEHRTRATRERTAATLDRQPVRPVAGPADLTESNDRMARLRAAIGRLPEEQRVILSLATMAGLTSAQIGEILGRPPGTVRYELGRARRLLAAALEEE